MALSDLRNKLPALRQLLFLLQFSRGKKSEYASNLNEAQLSNFLNARYLSYKNKIQQAQDFIASIDSVISLIEGIVQERDANPDLEPVFPDDPRYQDTRFRLQTPSDPNAEKADSPFRLSFNPPKTYDGVFLLSHKGLYYDAQTGGLDPVNIYLSGLELPSPGDYYKFNHDPNLGGRGVTLSMKDLDTFNNTLFDIDLIDNSLEMREHYDADHFLQTLIGNKNKKIFDLSSTIQDHEVEGSGDAIVHSFKQQLNFEAGRFDDLIKRRKKQIEVAIKAPALYGTEFIPDPEGTEGTAPVIDPFAAGGTYGGPGDLVPGTEPTAGEPGGGAGGTSQSGGNVTVGGGVREQEVDIVPQALFRKGAVPVNDFSYLAALNFSVDPVMQKALLFDNADVEGIVKPINAKYTKPFGEGAEYSFDNLLVPPIGKGGIFYNLSSTEVELVSLNDNIETDNLFAIYNYLEGKVSSPNATRAYDLSNVLNCAANFERENAARMLGMNASSVFADGLGIPYLAGMTRKQGLRRPQTNHNTSFDSVSAVSAVGSVVIMPDTPSFRDFTYGTSGWTFETWVRVPNLDASAAGWGQHHGNSADGPTISASSLTRAILACENTGQHQAGITTTFEETQHLGSSSLSIDRLKFDKSNNLVRGLVCGFTCDRRLTENESHTNEHFEQNPGEAGKLSFFIAPTISRDSSSCSWINKNPQISIQDNESQDPDGPNWHPTYEYFALTVDARTVYNKKGENFLECQNQFMLVTVTVDPKEDKVKVYLDGDLMKSQSINATFGSPAKRPINIPSIALRNSFRYSSSSINGPSEFFGGPNYEMFTPWVVGGGWTDGMVFNHQEVDLSQRYSGGGGFMGSHAGGLVSGLRGYVGSTKFYNTALKQDKIEKNYKAQKAMFKNIDLRETKRKLTH